MTKRLTEVIGEQATDALHEAIRVAWQAGYDQALLDLDQHEARGLYLVKDGE